MMRARRDDAMRRAAQRYASGSDMKITSIFSHAAITLDAAATASRGRSLFSFALPLRLFRHY